MTTPIRTARPWLPVLVLVLAVGQVASSLLITNSFTVSDRSGEPPIVPSGYAFAIWGAIEALSIAYAIWALVTRGPGPELRERIAAPLAVVFAGFSAWIVAAAVEPVWSTVVIFAVMFGGLLQAMRVAFAAESQIRRWGRLGSGLLWGLLGLYTGWTSIAVWVNLTTAFAGSGAPITGTTGVLGQLAILAGATATAAAIIWWTRALLSYAATTVWAFIGAALGASGAGESLLAGTAVIGLATIVVVTLVRRIGPGARAGVT